MEVKIHHFLHRGWCNLENQIIIGNTNKEDDSLIAPLKNDLIAVFTSIESDVLDILKKKKLTEEGLIKEFENLFI